MWEEPIFKGCAAEENHEPFDWEVWYLWEGVCWRGVDSGRGSPWTQRPSRERNSNGGRGVVSIHYD